jgi:hypothetical protein
MSLRGVIACCCATLLVGVAACADSPPAPTQDSVEIRSANPAPGTSLTANSQQTFSYDVRLTLKSERAIAGLVFVPDGQIHNLVMSPVISVGRGSTTVTLSHTLSIAAGIRRLDVLIAMEAQDRIAQTSTTLTNHVQ